MNADYCEARLIILCCSKRWRRHAKSQLPLIAFASLIVLLISWFAATKLPQLRFENLPITFALTYLASAVAYGCLLLIPRSIKFDGRSIVISTPGYHARVLSVQDRDAFHVRGINERFLYVFTSSRDFVMIAHNDNLRSEQKSNG